MKMDRVTLRERSSVGAKAVVLYDSVVDEDASLMAMSLVMKGEVLPAGTTWSGIPAQKVSRPPTPVPAPARHHGQAWSLTTAERR
jgi:carbonic anhydrase/acetyltransferase-like protein (isoleucine patch superfamily)